MDDIIVYLIFLAFALLSRFLTKKKGDASPPPAQGRSQRQDNEGRPSERPKSFEELLSEFTEQKEPETQRKRQYEEVDTYEEENYEERYSRDEEAKEIYQESVKKAKGLKTIDELVDYDKIKTKLDQDKFDPYSKVRQDTLADKIRKDLQNSHEVRKAIVYSEILKRKY